MKLPLATATAAMMVMILPSQGYTTGGGYRFRRPPRSDTFRKQQEKLVDRAFSELASEFGYSAESREQARKQQQEWLNRAFGLASEVASEISSSPRQVKESNEARRQQQEWANRAFDIANDVAFGFSSPRYTIHDDDEKFQVEMDVPGVEASAIDILVEDDGQIIAIRGEREVGQGDISHTAKFSKTFSLDPNTETDQITAQLNNGVLLVSAPKKQVKEEPKKIPVVQMGVQDIEVGSVGKSDVEANSGAAEAPKDDELLDLDNEDGKDFDSEEA